MGPSQKQRGNTLFAGFPHIESSYKLAIALKNVYETAKTRSQAELLFDRWHELAAEKIQKDEVGDNDGETSTKKNYSSFQTASNLKTAVEAHVSRREGSELLSLSSFNDICIPPPTKNG